MNNKVNLDYHTVDEVWSVCINAGGNYKNSPDELKPFFDKYSSEGYDDLMARMDMSYLIKTVNFEKYGESIVNDFARMLNGNCFYEDDNYISIYFNGKLFYQGDKKSMDKKLVEECVGSEAYDNYLWNIERTSKDNNDKEHELYYPYRIMYDWFYSSMRWRGAFPTALMRQRLGFYK